MTLFDQPPSIRGQPGRRRSRHVNTPVRVDTLGSRGGNRDVAAARRV